MKTNWKQIVLDIEDTCQCDIAVLSKILECREMDDAARIEYKTTINTMEDILRIIKDGKKGK